MIIIIRPEFIKYVSLCPRSVLMETKGKESRKRIKVAVWMVTYNHEKFIGRAIESVLNQKGEFDLTLFIGEDCSTDGTRAICLDYKQKYPDQIQLILQKENRGIVWNVIDVFEACKNSGAVYLAQCEGDDHWIDDNKLKRQIDFLEDNPKYALCSTRFKIRDQKTGEIRSDLLEQLPIFNDEGFEINLDVYFKYWVTKTMTVVSRMEYLDVEKMKSFKYLRDVHVYALMLDQAPGYCLNFFSAEYTEHEGGIWSKVDKTKRMLTSLKSIQELSPLFKENSNFKARESRMLSKLLLKEHAELKISELGPLIASHIRVFGISFDLTKNLVAKFLN